jgi:U32 family peptidase
LRQPLSINQSTFAAMNSNEIEIMAPVGSYESLMAAIQGKADSVYFGIGHLNMRSKSTLNFTSEDLKTISEICRENHIRSYITLNSVIFDEELQIMRTIIEDAKKAGISAIIASDQAAIQYAADAGMEVHMSTQANITNSEAIRYYSKYADVMVTARELDLDQVRAITEAIEKERIIGPHGELVKIEVFAHGALCMAVSGKCYLSLDNFNSSANRGACLQVCRRPYKVFDRDGEVELAIDNQYIMSPKDLKTIDFIDKILDARVKVLKIEGRGRSPEYVKTVTRCYREAVNAFYEGNFTKEKLELWNMELGTVYNRGFWDGYYLGRKMGEWSGQYGSQATRKKVYVGKIMNYFARTGIAELKVEAQPLHAGDDILVIGPTTGVIEDRVSEIQVDDKMVGKAIKGDLCTLPVGAFLRPSDKLYKWVDSKNIPAQAD